MIYHSVYAGGLSIFTSNISIVNSATSDLNRVHFCMAVMLFDDSGNSNNIIMKHKTLIFDINSIQRFHVWALDSCIL